VANPGCYPTGALLALAPAARAGIIQPDVIIDAKSGVSGAGRSLGLAYHYAEANESVSAYAMGGHRHLPEITQELKRLWPGSTTPRVTFQPHLIPMTRGIFTTAYASWPTALSRGQRTAAVRSWHEAYRESPSCG
jgi:N-acetyl-gamma-glutamyl-phosphate reductase